MNMPGRSVPRYNVRPLGVAQQFGLCGQHAISTFSRRPVGTGCVMLTDVLAAFDDWLDRHGTTLALPVTIIERDLDMIRLGFTGITKAIEVVVVRNEVSIVVEHDGINWDTLAWFDCAPKVDRKKVCSAACTSGLTACFPEL
jgi:hypothetical protein